MRGAMLQTLIVASIVMLVFGGWLVSPILTFQLYGFGITCISIGQSLIRKNTLRFLLKRWQRIAEADEESLLNKIQFLFAHILLSLFRVHPQEILA